MAVARAPVPGLRRLAQHPPAAAGGVRDERDEGGPQRRAQLLHPRRLVGRVLRRPQRLGHHLGRGRARPGPAGPARGRVGLRPAREPDRAPLLRPRRRRRAPGLGPPGQGRATPRSARRSRPAAWSGTTCRSTTSPRPRPPTSPSPTTRARARELAAWRARVVAAWPGVKVAGVESDGGPAVLGRGAPRRGHRRPGLAGADGRRGAGPPRAGRRGRRDPPARRPTLTHVGVDDAGRARWEGHFRCARAGRYGFTARVVPDHQDLATPVELGLVTWA